MIDTRTVATPAPAAESVRDERSMKLFEYFISALALLAAAGLALMR